MFQNDGEGFRATKVIYIEPHASRPPPTFQESSENSKEEKNIKRNILEALQHADIIGGLEETLQGIQWHFSPPTPIVIVISDF